jgi:putative membrane protein
MYSKADHDRVHDAIAQAETRTSGEIFCVVAKESGSYREVPLAWAAIVALLGPPLALIVGFRPDAVVRAVSGLTEGGWVAAHAGALNSAVMAALIGYALVQLVLFVATLGLVMIPGARRVLTPGSVKRAHVHARAVEQFAHRLHQTSDVTGVLIFASLAERRVEVIGDEDIHAKVGDAAWDAAVAAALAKIRTGDVAGGLVEAVGICGQALAEHFPPDASHRPAGDVAEI